MDLTGTPGTTSRYQHYKLLRRPDGTPWELGRGTMGVTYKAFDVNLRCEVALKVVNPALLHHPHARERFIREARAAARLRHRNIASVYHLGSDGDRFFYAMEFIDGETLDALVRGQGPLSPDDALRVLLQVARALAAAARQGVIHRDIKPGNLMVVHEDDDDHRVVKLIDFGLARAAAVDDEPGNLTSNGFVGTPVYSSPEQMAEKPADARSDIYSLGVTAWFLLVGKPPFGGTVASIFQQHASKQPPWDHLPAGLPAPVRTLLARMLEKNPARRPQTAVELRQEIETCRESLAAPGVSRDLSSASVAPRPAESPATPRAESASPGAPLRELGPGMILKGRYELIRLAGEGNSGQVFEIRDRAAQDETRALKLFRAEMTGDLAKRESVEHEFRQVEAAPHANLIRLYAFERLGSRAVDFLVEEWLRGFTLLDWLAVRGGALPHAEALQVLAQAAAAVDHAAGNKQDRLDLTLHQLHIHFPSLSAAVGGDEAVRGLMGKPLADWPRWVLKVNPLGAFQGGLESSTWAGELTHLPGAAPALDRDMRLDEHAESSAASYRRALARTVYEMLGGASAGLEPGQDKRAKYVSLPALSEQANAVLQGALVEEDSPHATSRAFYEALAAATGNKILPSEERSGRGSGVAAVPAVAGPASNRARVLKAPPSTAVSSDSAASSAAGFFDPNGSDGDRDSYASRTSVSERLALMSNGGRQYRSWLPTIIVGGLLVLVCAVILFALITRHPTRPKSTSSASRPREQNAAARPSAGPTPTASKGTPPVHPSPSGSPVRRDSPAGLTPTPMEAMASTPPPLSPTPAPRETLVKVRVETKPSGAEIRMAGKLLGTTPLEISLSPGDHQLVARYRNWPEVRHTMHLDGDQLTALDEIHMIPPTLVPSAEASLSASVRNRRLPSPTPRRTTPIPSGNSVVHFPSPSASPTPSARGLEPFLAQPTPARRVRPANPFDPDGSSQPAPRRRTPEPGPSQTDDSGD